MTVDAADIRQLIYFRTTVRGSNQEIPTSLSEDFEYSWGVIREDRQSFVAAITMEGPLLETQVLDIVITEERAAALFRGVDPVTMLSHTIAWFMVLRHGRIVKIVEVHEAAPDAKGL